jgi:hypothetical protein
MQCRLNAWADLQQYFSYIGDQFYWWRKQEWSEKTTDLSQITANLSNPITVLFAMK